MKRGLRSFQKLSTYQLQLFAAFVAQLWYLSAAYISLMKAISVCNHCLLSNKNKNVVDEETTENVRKKLKKTRAEENVDNLGDEEVDKPERQDRRYCSVTEQSLGMILRLYHVWIFKREIYEYRSSSNPSLLLTFLISKAVVWSHFWYIDVSGEKQINLTCLK